MMTGNNVKILVCCHKDDIKAESDFYLPIHVGKALSDIDLGIRGDNDGDNISAKNSSYCELTGLYWAWKNLKDVDYIGLCHYRRYFDFYRIGRKGFPFTTFPTEAFSTMDMSISDEAMEWLQKGYAIFPQSWNLRYSVYLEYCEHHNSSDFRALGDVIRELSPDYYKETIKKTMINSNYLMPYNMFIMSKAQLNNYCEWLFKILFEVEKRIDITNYDSIQKRVFGYMGERLLNIYVAAERVRYKQFPIIKYSEEKELYAMSLSHYRLRCLMNNLALKLTKY